MAKIDTDIQITAEKAVLPEFLQKCIEEGIAGQKNSRGEFFYIDGLKKISLGIVAKDADIKLKEIVKKKQEKEALDKKNKEMIDFMKNSQMPPSKESDELRQRLGELKALQSYSDNSDFLVTISHPNTKDDRFQNIDVRFNAPVEVLESKAYPSEIAPFFKTVDWCEIDFYWFREITLYNNRRDIVFTKDNDGNITGGLVRKGWRVLLKKEDKSIIDYYNIKVPCDTNQLPNCYTCGGLVLCIKDRDKRKFDIALENSSMSDAINIDRHFLGRQDGGETKDVIAGSRNFKDINYAMAENSNVSVGPSELTDV